MVYHTENKLVSRSCFQVYVSQVHVSQVQVTTKLPSHLALINQVILLEITSIRSTLKPQASRYQIRYQSIFILPCRQSVPLKASTHHTKENIKVQQVMGPHHN